MKTDVLIGGIHDIALPAMIESTDKASMGLIMFIGSSTLDRGTPICEPHITYTLNRRE